MQLRVFTLAFSEATAGFPDEAVRRFLADKHVLEVSDHLYVRAGSPYLTLVVRFEDPGATPSLPSARSSADEEKPRLAAADLALFKTLKTWRTERARKDGVPPYVVATNRLLAEVAALRPRSKAELGTIAGMGEAKVARYGDDLLALVPHPAPAEPEVVTAGEGPA